MADETRSPDDMPLGRRNYAQFADRYAAATPTKAANAYYDRPAVQSLLPEVAGRDVLDAGCGPGHYAAWLARRGARVVGLDVTPEMLALARAHVAGLAVTLLEADLERPLPLADAAFDVVMCPLVFDYIRDLGPTLREFRRVARPGATLVFSMGHPMLEWAWHGAGVYYDVEAVEMYWKGFGEPEPLVRSYRRPLAAIINPLIAAGWRLDRVLEPGSNTDIERTRPDWHAKLAKTPYFICMRAIAA
jgi:2-polyprenyl-6-hydroxyphenyl methylase/3-demethylubiquinone-9 3-methyltransferase